MSYKSMILAEPSLAIYLPLDEAAGPATDLKNGDTATPSAGVTVMPIVTGLTPNPTDTATPGQGPRRLN